MLSRDSTRCGRLTKISSRLNSAVVSSCSAPPPRPSSAARDVEHHILEGVALVRGEQLARPGPRRSVAPQHGPHPRQHLAQLERLGDVVVRAELEPDDAVDGVALAADHDDGDVAFGPDLAGELQAVLSAQRQIEGDQADRVLLDAGAQLGAVLGFDDPEPLALEALAQEGANLASSSTTRICTFASAIRDPPGRALLDNRFVAGISSSNFSLSMDVAAHGPHVRSQALDRRHTSRHMRVSGRSAPGPCSASAPASPGCRGGPWPGRAGRGRP